MTDEWTEIKFLPAVLLKPHAQNGDQLYTRSLRDRTYGLPFKNVSTLYQFLLALKIYKTFSLKPRGMVQSWSEVFDIFILKICRVSNEVLEHMLGWNIPEEHQDLVHEHWRNFPAVSKYWHYCLALIYTMLMVTSLTGNGIVIWIFGT